jgi:molecular chaperone HscB
MLADIQDELQDLWSIWDEATDTANQPLLDKTKAALVVLLNRRSYVRNLVRDVAEALA